MKAIGKIQELSLYAGDAALTNVEPFDEQENLFANDAVVVWKRWKRHLFRWYCYIAGYIKADVCRSIFIACICCTAISVSFYQMGSVQKSKMQRYLVALEEMNSKERSADVLLRNIGELERLTEKLTVLQGFSDHSTKVMVYLAVIHSYFSDRKLNALDVYFLSNIWDMEKDLSRMILSRGERSQRNAEMLYTHSLDILKSYALEKHSKAREKAQMLREDSRKTLVGHVTIYNRLLDVSFATGALFFILAIACIPGLGSHRKTGFV